MSPATLTYEARGLGNVVLDDAGVSNSVSITLDDVCEFCAARGPRDQLWHQDQWGVSGGVEIGDRFGAALAVGDFDGDGFDDLAAGVPSEDLVSNAVKEAGSVTVLYGSPGRLSNRDDFWDQEDLSGSDGSETSDHFGTAVAVGVSGPGAPPAPPSLARVPSETFRAAIRSHVATGLRPSWR